MATTGTPESLPAEELGRARLYSLLGRLLSEPPPEPLLRSLAAVRDGPMPLEHALGELAAAARLAEPAVVAREYHDLFVGLGRGELLPYASHYIAGALHERPLARLRGDLRRLGIARAEGRSEPEDHASGVLDAMAGLIDGSLGAVDPGEQARFWREHLASWLPAFFADLAEAESATFYRPVGRLGALLLGIEREAFGLQSRNASLSSG